jgi:four helix bundle protein
LKHTRRAGTCIGTVGATFVSKGDVDPATLKRRTLGFAVNVGRLCRSFHDQWPGRHVADQMFRSGTGVAANYHAACRARSRREFAAKLGIVVEEAEETLFWLEFAARSGVVAPTAIVELTTEAGELIAIFTASAKTASANAAGLRGRHS